MIWMQLLLPEAFPGAGPRPSKCLNVARLESRANLKNAVVGNPLELGMAQGLVARRPTGAFAGRSLAWEALASSSASSNVPVQTDD